MAKISEDTLNNWSKPPSYTEETKLSNSKSMVDDAIRNFDDFNGHRIKIIGQGSYENDTNIRLDSDIDINVCYTEIFHYDLPPNISAADLGFSNNGLQYTVINFKTKLKSFVFSFHFLISKIK